MPLPYPRRIAPKLKVELSRLKSGNSAERQRYENALGAMNKVVSSPLHAQFRKELPENYKAADVLQQYRLFFRIVPAVDATDLGVDVVFFVWINDEDSVHRSGEPDDCYQVFRDKVERGEIDGYVPEMPPLQERFKLHDEWGSEFVYVSFTRIVIEAGEQNASAHLVLNKIIGSSYRIDYITVSTESAGLASALLVGLCGNADQYRIELVHELERGEKSFGKTRHLLEKFSFRLDDVIGETEIWIRAPQ